MSKRNIFYLTANKMIAGSVIDDVCNEAAALATITEMPVEFSFNGIRIVAKPNCNPGALVRAYNEGCKALKTGKVAWEV